MKNHFKTPILIFLMSLPAVPLFSQPVILPLWNGTPPLQQELYLEEVHTHEEILRISNVQTPMIEVYLPDQEIADGSAVLIFPGGGYTILAYDWEGTDFAKWLQKNGVTGIVVKYRLPVSESLTDPKEAPLADAQRAIRLVRHHAEDWGIDPGQVGIMGFSAGGHLAATLSTQYNFRAVPSSDTVDSLSAKPDFTILIYPVISFRDSSVHSGSRRNLLGEEPSQDLIDRFSGELHVTNETPPAFLIHSQDDTGVPVRNSLLYFEALTRNGVPASLHVYPTGGHGFAFGTGRGTVGGWTNVLLDWLKQMKQE
jgi:acetyl esterase/lipase